MLMFLLGLIIGAGAKALWDYKKAKGIKFTVLQYLILGGWVAWVACGLLFVVTSLGEYETRAASLGGLIFGVVALAALVLMRAGYLRSRARA